jgi:hypothetical protein
MIPGTTAPRNPKLSALAAVVHRCKTRAPRQPGPPADATGIRPLPLETLHQSSGGDQRRAVGLAELAADKPLSTAVFLAASRPFCELMSLPIGVAQECTRRYRGT